MHDPFLLAVDLKDEHEFTLIWSIINYRNDIILNFN